MKGRIQIPSVFAPYCLSLERSVGALVYREGGGVRTYLLMRYPHGHWEFPRGHIEDGETEHETMFREIHEETSIDRGDLIVHERFRSGFSFSYRAHGGEYESRVQSNQCIYIHKKVIFYLAQYMGANVTLSHEHTEFAWLPYEEAMQTLTYPNAQKVITQAEKILTKTRK